MYLSPCQSMTDHWSAIFWQGLIHNYKLITINLSQFSNRFSTIRNSIPRQINRKMVITIQMWFGLTRFGKYFSVLITWVGRCVNLPRIQIQWLVQRRPTDTGFDSGIYRISILNLIYLFINLFYLLFKHLFIYS